MRKTTLIELLTNAGGEGKTTIGKAIEAIMRILGLPVQMIDGDAGNRSAKVADGDAISIAWTTGSERAQALFDKVKDVNAIFDLGANTMASGSPIAELVLELQEQFEVNGHPTVALLPVSPNKLGAVEAILKLDKRLPDFPKYFVSVDRDGSANFGHGLPPDRTIRLGHLAPGLIAVLHQYPTWDAAITSPKEGYGLAAAYITEWLREFAEQPLVKQALGVDPVPAIDALGLGRPPKLLMRPKTAEASHDRMLAGAPRLGLIMARLMSDGATAASLRRLANDLDDGRL